MYFNLEREKLTLSRMVFNFPPIAEILATIFTSHPSKLHYDFVFAKRATTGSYTYSVIDPSLIRSTASSMA